MLTMILEKSSSGVSSGGGIITNNDTNNIKNNNNFQDKLKKLCINSISNNDNNNDINHQSLFPTVINLNVGGYLFTTSLSTLTKYEDSMLAVMFSGRHEIVRDDQGRYFIDRDGKYFRYILNFSRSNDLPPESVALDVLKEAEFFCMTTLIERLEAGAPKVISLRRREYFRHLIPDYESIKNNIITKATEKKHCFEESRVVITRFDHPKLKGQIPCYNCTREFVSVNHTCAFENLPSDITISLKTIDIDMDKLVNFVVDELSNDGFRVNVIRVICKFSLRCQGCTVSGLYTAGKYINKIRNFH
jgi:BTB/POZ domain-containing protein KCTD7/14